jgi:Na+/H+ antiporter NhaC
MPTAKDHQAISARSAGRSWIVGALILICLAATAFSPAPQATASAAAPVEPKDFYGLWSMAPPLVAIVLAVLTRQVIVALSLGVLTGAAMMCVAHGVYSPVQFVTYAVDHYVVGVLALMKSDGSGVDAEHITIILYTLFMGAMIGVSRANGGTQAVVARVTRRVRTRRAGQLSAYAAGLLVFFDDYASAMIVGPGLRPIFDRLRLSREKLAYIVNWTAAPDSSIFLGTWLAVQISYLDGGFQMLGDNVPAFLAGTNAATTFWATIPYRTYTVLVLVMVAWVALTGRDFGGMRRAEDRTARGDDSAGPAQAEPAATLPTKLVETGPAEAGPTPTNGKRWFLGAAPALLLVLMTVGLMAITGWQRTQGQGLSLGFGSGSSVWESLGIILAKSDSHFALLYASLSAAVLAIVLSVGSRALTLSKTMQGAVSGMTAMFAACIILALAWGLARAGKDLQLGPVAEEFLSRQIERGFFSVAWLPPAIFLTACLISFSTGTSWGTMAILCPPVVRIAAGLLASQPPEQALPMFYYCVGGAMAGAVFGNTCSPLADVTVLSSIFTGCDLYAHVRTTLPYAIVVAITGAVCTDGLRCGLQRWRPDWYAQHWSVYYGLLTGAVMLLVLLLVFGRGVSRRAVEGGAKRAYAGEPV